MTARSGDATPGGQRPGDAAAAPVGKPRGWRRLIRPLPVGAAVAATPPGRDRVVDAARAASLAVVVFGHGVMAVVAWPGGAPVLGNLLAAFPWTQALTWALQIMPLFFFAGGAANALSMRKAAVGEGWYAPWLWTRGQRLLRPVWVYLAVMAAVAAVVTWLVRERVSAPLLALITQLLWFLGVYLIVTALTPWLVPSRWPGLLGRLGTLLAAAALVDAVRLLLGGPEFLGLANFVLVWSIPAVCGAGRAVGLFAATRPWPLVGVALAATTLNAVLIRQGPWPVSMVGMPGEPVSNMAPPTIVLALHSIALVALIQAADAPLRRWLARPRVWAAAVAVNLVAMTIYLWHLPVLIGVTTAAHYLRLDRPVALDPSGAPVPDGWGYAAGSVLFWAAYSILVVGVVALAWPAEYAHLPWWDAPTRARALRPLLASTLAASACVVIGAATLALSATGLAGFPTRITPYAGLPLSPALSLVLLVAGGAVLRRAGAPAVAPRGTMVP